MRILLRYPLQFWRWLTSMKTALILLFLLALGAIPGALLPQRSLNQDKVTAYITAGGKLAEIYDKLYLYDVFSSPWFTAIYVLLFVSLIGCIIPRSWEHYRAYRKPVVQPPLRLSRLPHFAQESYADHDTSAAEVEEKAARLLKGWRVQRYATDKTGNPALAAERGYARELCNLLFHLGLVGMMVSVVVGKFNYYEGQVIVVTDNGNSEFCNTAVSNYDSLRSGPLFDGTTLTPFCVNVKDFTAKYLPNGQADDFSSNVSYAAGDDIFTPVESWADATLKVNHPLRLAGDRIYLQGHGYAPTVTITWPNGESRTQTVQFRPDDQTFFLSSGAMRFDPPAGMYPDDVSRRTHQISLQGLFAPTAAFNGTILSSSYPALTDPALAIDIYRGDNGLDTGRAQSLFSLDHLQIASGELQKLDRVNLRLGESVTLDDGTKLTFDGAKEFVNLQVSHDSTQIWVLLTAVITLAGLAGSLLIKRRRIWLRFGPEQVELAGLSRTDRSGWGEEFQKFHRQLFNLPDPEDDDPE